MPQQLLIRSLDLPSSGIFQYNTKPAESFRWIKKMDGYLMSIYKKRQPGQVYEGRTSVTLRDSEATVNSSRREKKWVWGLYGTLNRSINLEADLIVGVSKQFRCCMLAGVDLIRPSPEIQSFISEFLVIQNGWRLSMSSFFSLSLKLRDSDSSFILNGRLGSS